MKLKTVLFGGVGLSHSARELPMLGNVPRLFVGKEFLLTGGGKLKVSALEMDERSRILTVRLVDGEGKPSRTWWRGQPPIGDDNVADALRVFLGEHDALLCDDEPAQAQGQKR